MNVKVIKNILSNEDISTIMSVIDEELASRTISHKDLEGNKDHGTLEIEYWKERGRIDIRNPKIPQSIIDKFCDVVKENMIKPLPMGFDFVIHAEYSTRSGGNPKLIPHFDISMGATLILDYQLESNVSWGIGVESTVFDLEDNSGILFDPLEYIHYRPVKTFKDGEFVKMLFLRFNIADELKIQNDEDHLRLYKITSEYNLEERDGFNKNNDSV